MQYVTLQHQSNFPLGRLTEEEAAAPRNRTVYPSRTFHLMPPFCPAT